MPTPDKTPKLRLAPPETPEELAHRFERETRPVLLQRECAPGEFAGAVSESAPCLISTPCR